MKYIITLALTCCMYVGAFAQKPGDPCCSIIGTQTAKGIITSRNNTTGKVQQFKTSPARISSLRIGDKLTLQGGKIIAVNQTGYEPVNEIAFGNQTGFEPINDIVNQTGYEPINQIVTLQINEFEPVNGIVTVKNMKTGQLQTFKTMAGIGHTLTLGQRVSLQNGYAIIQSGANATPTQKGMYAFKVGMDSFAVKQHAVEEKDAEKWVITPSGAKGVTGNVTIVLPAGTNWYLYFQTTAGKDLVRLDNTKSHSLIPGNYNITVSSVPVLEVPVQKGMNTRLKAGTLHVVSTGKWGLYDEGQTKNYVSHGSPMKLGLPIGKYAIYINGQYQQVEIKDGEVTEF